MTPERSQSGTCAWLSSRSRGTSTDSASSCNCFPRRRRRSSWWRVEAEEAPTPPPTWLYMTVWLAAVLVYINGFTGDFVHDDISAIKTNPDVLGSNPLSHVFFNDYWGKPMSDPRSHKSYRPLTILTFRWSHSVFGLRPLGFHLVNVLLHSCACLLLTRLLLRLLNLPQGTVLSAGLIFATQPIHTEAVTGLVGRADVLASLSFIAAILSYHRAIERESDDPSEDTGSGDEGLVSGELSWEGKRPQSFSQGAGAAFCNGISCDASRREGPGVVREGLGVEDGGREDEGRGTGVALAWLRRTGVLAGVGTLCKEHALSALAVCAAWDIIVHRKHVWRLVSRRRPATKGLRPLVRRLVRLSVMGALILLARLWLLRGSSPVFSDQDNPASFSPSLLTRTLTLWYLPALNAWLLLCPWRLAHDWQMGSVPLLTSPADPRNLASVFFYAALLLLFRAGCITKGREGRALLLGVALLVVPFLPATNLFFTVGFVVAERILYIPSLGYSVLLAVGLSRAGRLRAPGLLFLLIVFSCRTLQRNRDWQSRETLFLAGLRTLPHNAKMHYNYANLQKDLGNIELAKQHYQEAIRLWPGHSSAHNNLGTLIADVSQAEVHFRLALKAHPYHANAYFNLANLRKQQGRVGEAVALLEESLRHDATNRDAVSALAGLYGDDGRITDAENLHLTLLAARPSDPVVHNNYAAFLQKVGRREAALVHYETALGLDPQHTVALVNTAALMTLLHHNTQAERLYKRALALWWEAEVGESLGKLYLNSGRLEDAVAVFTTVVTHHPHRLSTRVCLARVKLQQRSYIESEELLRHVLSQDPSHQEALFQLSLLYTHTNRTQDARTVAHKAAHNCSSPPTLCARFHAHYGDLMNDMHNTEAAAQSYHLAVELEPTLTHAHVNLGAIYHTRSYHLAVELEPTLTHAHVNLGAIYHTRGDYDRAWRHYLAAHGQEPSNSLLLENMEKLRRVQHLHPPAGLPHCLNLAMSPPQP